MSKFSSIHQNIAGSIAALGHSIQNLTSAVTLKDNNESHLEKYGYLIRRGMFKQWVKRYVELVIENDGASARLSHYIVKGGPRNGSIVLNYSSICDDSKERPFCFTLKNDTEEVFLAADNGFDKDSWMESINSVLSSMRKFHRKAQMQVDSDDNFHSLYTDGNSQLEQHRKPTIYIKIIRAFNLIDVDSGGTSDPYVQITVNRKKDKTHTIKKELNPEWGEVFHFEWARGTRYANIEVWDSNESTSHVYLGGLTIPLFHLYGSVSNTSWYNLGKRSTRSNIRGKIEVEYSCAGFPGIDINVIKLYREVLAMRDMHVPFLTTDSNTNCYKSFPFALPPIESETLEDISTKVQLKLSGYNGDVSSRGILLLTSYRLIFVSIRRLTIDQHQEFTNNTDDMTTFIPLNNIIDVTESTDIGNSNSTTSNEVINIKTCDGRHFHFVFFSYAVSGTALSASAHNNKSKRSIQTSDASRLNSALPDAMESMHNDVFAVKVDSSNTERDGYDEIRSMKDVFKPSTRGSLNDGNHIDVHSLSVDGVHKAWYNLNRQVNMEKLESYNSDEGSPCHRIFSRVMYKKINRHVERLNSLELSKALLSSFRKGCTIGRSPMTHINSSDTLNIDDTITTDSGSDEEKARSALSYDHLTIALQSLPVDSRKLLVDQLEMGWTIYDPEEEFKRMLIPDSHWRLTNLNVSYQLCSTYPSVLAVPINIDDGTLTAAAAFRSRNRFPALSWRHPKNKCSICRCSQPLVGPMGHRNSNDEFLIESINRKGGIISNDESSNDAQSHRRKYIIIDARPYVNATANMTAGKGFESDKNYDNCTISFMNIPNIHVIRKSLEALKDACVEENWLRALDTSGWLEHIFKVLKASLRIVHSIHYETLSVLVHCSDGWDRTAQLTSLSMLMMDPYYRSLKGFMVLIEKEWVSFGHKFCDRSAWGLHGWKDEEYSPIFQQFIDCVYQIMHQHPCAFEFNEDLLLFIVEHTYTGWFGNFLFNSEKEKKEFGAWQNCISIWSVVLNDPKRFTNESYRLVEGVVLPIINKQSIVLWQRCYMSWHNRIWHMSYAQDNQLDDFGDNTTQGYVSIEKSIQLLWADDSHFTKCKRCDKAFGLFRRKHHCRVCGNIYCDVCANEYRLISSVTTSRMSRCCLDCAKRIDILEDSNMVAVNEEDFLGDEEEVIPDIYSEEAQAPVARDNAARDRIIYKSIKLGKQQKLVSNGEKFEVVE